MEATIYYVAQGPNIWARSTAQQGAIDEMRKHGGIRKGKAIPTIVYKVIMETQSTEKPYIDGMGYLVYGGDAEYETVLQDKKHKG
jgi:hypothetical protein